MLLTRTFLALELDDATRTFISARVRALALALPQVRFVAAATWHVTLAFLGDLDESMLAQTTLAARDAADQAAPFTLHAANVGIFGADADPRVIWLGVGGTTSALLALQQAVVAALHARGVPYRDTHFAPHITLARPRQPFTAPAAAAFAQLRAATDVGPALSVTAISVMRSELAPTGARYTALARAPFRQPLNG